MRSIKFIAFFLFISTTFHAIAQDFDKMFEKRKYKEIVNLLIKKDKTKKLSSDEYIVLSRSLGRLQQHTNGMSYANKLFKLSYAKKDTANTLQAINLKAEHLIDMARYRQGIELCESSIQLFREQDSVLFQSLCFKWGMMYYETGNYQKAYETYNKITRKIYTELPLFINNYALALRGVGRYREALKYLKKGNEIDLKRGYKDVSVGISSVASVYMDLNEWDNAKKYLDSARQLVYPNSQSRDKEIIYKGYFRYYKHNKKIDLTLKYLDSINATQGDITADRVNEKLYALETAHEKELLLNKQLEDAKKEKLWLVIALLSIIIALLSALYLYKYKNIKMAHDQVLTEQKLLRSQMTPHFIFNSLSVLQGMILNNETDKSVKYLSKFSRLLRLILENSREKLVPLSQELEAVQNYIELKNMRGKKPIEFSVSVDQAIHSENILIPPMLIQPFIENAIVHGFAEDNTQNKIHIEFSLKNNALQCIIRDNGIGLNATKNNISKDKKSLSTQITSERLAILSKELKSTGKVSIIDRKNKNEQGTEVQLTLPYKTI